MSESPIRVLFTHLGSSGGGPKFHFHLFSSLLGRDGIEPYYLISRNADNYSLFMATGAPHLVLPTYKTKIGLLVGLPRLCISAIRLRSYIKRERISVVVNSMESIYQGLIARFAIPRGVRYISCVHDAVDHPGDEHLIKKISRHGERCRANQFIVFSAYVREALEKQAFVSGRVIKETVHGVFGDVVPRDEKSVSKLPESGRLRIGFVGRLGRYKGLDTLANSIRILRCRGHKVEGYVYGAGPEAALSTTEVGSSLKWNIGWIADEAFPDILDSFDVLALPYKEASQSGVIAYAMSRGIPMVVTPVGGLGEQIERASCGVIARSTSDHDFANALEVLVKNRELRRQCRDNALEASRTIYSWTRVGDDISGWLTE